MAAYSTLYQNSRGSVCLGALQSGLGVMFAEPSGCVWRQMWTAPIEMLPPAWARVNLDAVTAVHPFPTTDFQVDIAPDPK